MSIPQAPDSVRSRWLLYLSTFPLRAGPMLLLGSIFAFNRSGIFKYIGLIIFGSFVIEIFFYLRNRKLGQVPPLRKS